MTLNYYGVVLVIAYVVAAADLIIAHWHPSLPFRRDNEPELEGVNEPENVDRGRSVEGSAERVTTPSLCTV